MDFLKRKPKDLDGAEAEGQDAVDETGSIIDNDKAQKRQRMIFFGIGGVAVIAATMFVLDTGETVDEAVTAGTETEVSTDALMNRSEEHTSELPSLMGISYAGFCLEKEN